MVRLTGKKVKFLHKVPKGSSQKPLGYNDPSKKKVAAPKKPTGPDLTAEQREKIKLFFNSIADPGKRNPEVGTLSEKQAVELMSDATVYMHMIRECMKQHPEERLELMQFFFSLLSKKYDQKTYLSTLLEQIKYEEDPSVWGKVPQDVAELRQQALQHLQETRSLSDVLSEISVNLGKVKDQLNNTMCPNSIEVVSLNDSLDKLLEEVKFLLNRCLKHSLSLSQFIYTPFSKDQKMKEADQAKGALFSLLEAYNKQVDEFNNKLLEYFHFIKCRDCYIQSVVNAYHIMFRAFRAWWRKTFGKIYNPSKKLKKEVDALSRRVHELSAQIKNQESIYIDKVQEEMPIRKNEPNFSNMNGLLSQIGQEVEQVNQLAGQYTVLVNRLSAVSSSPSFTLISGNVHDPDQQIKVIEQTRNLRNYYGSQLAKINKLVLDAVQMLRKLEEYYSKIDSLCREVETIVGTLPVFQVAEFEKPQVGKVAESVLHVNSKIGDYSENIRALLASTPKLPENLTSLVALIRRYGDVSTRPILDSVSEMEVAGAFFSGTLTIEKEQEVIEALKQLRRNELVIELLKKEPKIETVFLASAAECAGLKIPLKIYIAGQSLPPGISRMLFDRAIADLLSTNGQELGRIGDERLNRIQFVERMLPQLSLSGISFYTQEFNSRYFKQHAAKHAGYPLEGYTDQRLDEFEQWRVIREGKGPLSAALLSVTSRKSQLILDHYEAVTQTLTRFNVPFLAIRGYEFTQEKVSPVVFFVKDLENDGLPGHAVFVSFSVKDSRALWLTTFITEHSDLLSKTNLSLITPLPTYTLH